MRRLRNISWTYFFQNISKTLCAFRVSQHRFSLWQRQTVVHHFCHFPLYSLFYLLSDPNPIFYLITTDNNYGVILTSLLCLCRIALNRLNVSGVSSCHEAACLPKHKFGLPSAPPFCRWSWGCAFYCDPVTGRETFEKNGRQVSIFRLSEIQIPLQWRSSGIQRL